MMTAQQPNAADRPASAATEVDESEQPSPTSAAPREAPAEEQAPPQLIPAVGRGDEQLPVLPQAAAIAAEATPTSARGRHSSRMDGALVARIAEQDDIIAKLTAALEARLKRDGDLGSGGGDDDDNDNDGDNDDDDATGKGAGKGGASAAAAKGGSAQRYLEKARAAEKKLKETEKQAR